MLNEINIESRKYLTCGKMSMYGIKNCFTTSLGGVSHGKVCGLNLGFRVGDEKDAVLENYRIVARDMGFDFENITVSKQEHTDNIKIVTKADCGKGVCRESDNTPVDGLVTAEKDLPLCVFSADCYPVLLADTEKRAAAAIHSGWRGTLKHISSKGVKIMSESFSAEPENIIAAIGPGIGACCFETEYDTAVLFDDKYIIKKLNDKYFIDLTQMIKDDLTCAGVREENIFISGRCSVCESNIFYSYRSQRDKTGRMGAFIAL